MKKPRVLGLVVGVGVCAILATALLARFGVPGSLLGVSMLATLAALGGAGPVRIASLKTSINTTDAFVFTAIGAFGPPAAAVVAAAGVVGSAFGTQSQTRLVHFAFNTGNMVFSAVVASGVYLLAGGEPGSSIGGQVLPLFAATTIYFLLHTGLVALAVVFDTGQSFFKNWKESAQWTALSAWLGLTLAAGLLWAIQIVGVTGLALGVPPCWMLASFYRTHKDRQERQQERVRQVEQTNVRLEDRVAERTQELQEALSHIESANASLTTANERLTEANRAKSEFLANVSHELRTPLNAIIGFSDLLQEPQTGALSDQQTEFVGDIQESGEHLLNLINGILDLSKIEAGKMEAHPERVALARAIQEAVAMVVPQATSKQIALSVNCADDVEAASLDPRMFRQILLNLLSNAVKFTPAEGRVEVIARREDRDLIVSVADSGIGIDGDHLEKIFDEFFQVDGSYSRSYEGTGLGLALVRRMAELQGGEVLAESTPGLGSTFSCRFHERILECEPPAERTPPPPPTRPRGGGRTVLIVEDNPMNRKLARNVLRSRGFEVLEATTGEEALQLLARRVADLVLMDLQLPGLDGLEVTRRLKADHRTATLPIVALTAHVREVDEQRAIEAGCIGYITKPIRLAQFPKQVAAYLEEGRKRELVESG